MLRLLGLNAYVRALVGIGLAGVGIGTHRPLLIGIGGAIALWSAVNIVMELKNRERR
ncbi:hypothetical protein ACFWUU_11000 [Kribbella sp. NPDC058693]|uniref:hypothetical protein n=1 Tax=Kribbella TaxID=182639 RepID=UPI001484F7FE|nr:hypothetical protein [Kribbella jiaozuonensis]